VEDSTPIAGKQFPNDKSKHGCGELQAFRASPWWRKYNAAHGRRGSLRRRVVRLAGLLFSSLRLLDPLH
jgi:hypothetical protein